MHDLAGLVRANIATAPVMGVSCFDIDGEEKTLSASVICA
jgi:hypothetical protein